MTGKSKAARMGKSLPIAKNQVRSYGQLCERGERRRNFAKRKITGHVRETRARAHQRLFTRRKRRKIQHHGRSTCDAPVILKADIDAGNSANRTQPITRHDPAAQPLLHEARLRHAAWPRIVA